MANINAKLINEYNFKHQTVFSPNFNKFNEDGEISDTTELYIKLKNNQNSTESDIDNITIQLDIEKEIQGQEMNESGWSFDKTTSMIIYLFIEVLN